MGRFDISQVTTLHMAMSHHCVTESRSNTFPGWVQGGMLEAAAFYPLNQGSKVQPGLVCRS